MTKRSNSPFSDFNTYHPVYLTIEVRDNNTPYHCEFLDAPSRSLAQIEQGLTRAEIDQIVNDAFGENWGFYTISFSQLAHYYQDPCPYRRIH